MSLPLGPLPCAPNEPPLDPLVDLLGPCSPPNFPGPQIYSGRREGYRGRRKGILLYAISTIMAQKVHLEKHIQLLLMVRNQK